jgi:carboxypeptidase C (cathepsin A)
MLVNNPNSWNNFSNVLYVDAPIGTGYSFTRDEPGNSTRVYSIDYAVQDFIHFIKGFLNFHKEFRGRETYIVGQDFSGGKYLPAYVQAIQDLKKGKFEDE